MENTTLKNPQKKPNNSNKGEKTHIMENNANKRDNSDFFLTDGLLIELSQLYLGKGKCSHCGTEIFFHSAVPPVFVGKCTCGAEYRFKKATAVYIQEITNDN